MSSARTKARRRALDILFEAEQRDVSPLEVLRLRREATDQIINEYTVVLVEGVMSHLDRIDEILGTYARGWTLERMPSVDRTVLAFSIGVCTVASMLAGLFPALHLRRNAEEALRAPGLRTTAGRAHRSRSARGSSPDGAWSWTPCSRAAYRRKRPSCG